MTDFSSSRQARLLQTPQYETELSTPPARGTAWTLISALAVFALILIAVYSYLFPRLFGERVSSSAAVQIRDLSRNLIDGWSRMVLADKTVCFVSDTPLFSAADFSVFRGDGLQQPPKLTLRFSESGQQKSRVLRAQKPQELCLIYDGSAIAVIRSEDLTDNQVEIILTGISAEEANLLFARLTQ